MQLGSRLSHGGDSTTRHIQVYRDSINLENYRGGAEDAGERASSCLLSADGGRVSVVKMISAATTTTTLYPEMGIFRAVVVR